MDEKGSNVVISDKKINQGLNPMFFGASCAIFALTLLPEPEICDEKWLDIRNRMLKGSAHLLGLYAWKVQREVNDTGKSDLLHKLENAQKEIDELKRNRHEDAKANAKVVSIVSAREQTWADERRKLRQQIGSLMNDLRVTKMKTEKAMMDKLKECEVILLSKDKLIEEADQKRRESEEKLEMAEILADELRENGKREAQRHSSEISKHKTAFIELVSNQRQLEAEMGRALRQVEAAKQELDSIFEQKEQSVVLNQRLSMELVRMRNDLDQKDQILSAMLRKSKLDTAEKQMLLKEVKSSKVKKKKTEYEMKGVSEQPKHAKHSLRNMLSRHVKSDVFGNADLSKSLDAGNFRSVKKEYRIEFDQPEMKGLDVFTHLSGPYPADAIAESANAGHLQNWVTSETGKYNSAIEQRHNCEIDAFADQLRLKDEKLEAFRWRLLSMELESKRLQSHIEGLDHDITQLRQHNIKLEELILDREAELHTLKEQLVLQFNPPNLQKLHFSPSLPQDNTVWSKVKVVKRKPGKKPEMKPVVNETQAIEQINDIVLTLQSPENEIKEGKVTKLSPDHFRDVSIDSEDLSNVETSVLTVIKKSDSIRKMDIHALGVSYKIKRLKQQLLMLERLTGKQESSEKGENNSECFGIKGFYTLVSILNKQVDRYQSLQGKTDDLCNRMHDGNLNLNSGSSTIARTAVETKKLENFLEETFQLQRYIVATGQKLMEVQTKIASGFVADSEKEVEKPESFDIKRFADSIRTLLREVQRGLEVRISRLIGDLGGTLACDGITHFNK